MSSFFSKHDSESYTEQALAVSNELREHLQAWFAKYQGAYSVRVLEYLAMSQVKETSAETMARAKIKYKVVLDGRPEFESSSLSEAVPVYSGLLKEYGERVWLSQGTRVLIQGEKLVNTAETEKVLIQTWFRDQMGINVHG